MSAVEVVVVRLFLHFTIPYYPLFLQIPFIFIIKPLYKIPPLCFTCTSIKESTERKRPRERDIKTKQKGPVIRSLEKTGTNKKRY